ncbi:unnamed protein product [Nesidiocoris tenuis]|uniref:Uncharacterized protein n=1 Tax=Nesidiocoris tenuis TaxID=355587 RepID=A0A6H5HJU0_9HEMI|nr:unnamed protein product [Nesidiocoris tenuis]
MNNPKFREKVLIGLENAPPSFNVRGKVMGPNGANLLYITNETGAIVTIRGRGSGFLEPNTGTESIEPLHICIEHSKYEVLQAGRQLAFNLIDTVQQEWANLQHQIQQEQPQQQQPPPPPPPPQQQHQQPPSVVSSSSNGPPPSLVTNEGVEVVTSVAPPPTPVSMPPSSTAIMPPSSVALPAGFTQQAVSQMITVPPPSHVAIPPPTLHMPPQMATSQVTQVATSTTNGTLVHSSETSQTLVTAGTSTPGQEIAASQPPTQPPTINIPHQQQLFLSNQGAILQPQTLIPQQQQIITPTGQVISAQPQMLAQSYLLQTNSGQMVVSYPNIVRPAGTVADQMRGQQLMLVQYGEGGAVKTSAVRAPVPTAHQAVPQMVQIVNPQTGQIQHVLQHIQPQIQMQQAQLQPQLLQQGTNILGQQVLMPFQAPIQFTSQPQQMIITQPPPQMQQQQTLQACFQPQDSLVLEFLVQNVVDQSKHCIFLPRVPAIVFSQIYENHERQAHCKHYESLAHHELLAHERQACHGIMSFMSIKCVMSVLRIMSVWRRTVLPAVTPAAIQESNATSRSKSKDSSFSRLSFSRASRKFTTSPYISNSKVWCSGSSNRCNRSSRPEHYLRNLDSRSLADDPGCAVRTADVRAAAAASASHVQRTSGRLAAAAIRMVTSTKLTHTISTISITQASMEKFESKSRHILEFTASRFDPSVHLYEGENIWDVVSVNFGIRTISSTPSSILINGEPAYLKGFGMHQDAELRGRGFDAVQLTRDINLLKWTGANAIRTSHYPYTEEFLDMADRYGFMVILETPACSLSNFDTLLDRHKKVFAEMYYAFGHHPSVIMWSMANEPLSNNPNSTAYFKSLVDFAREFDTTRLFTFVTSQQILNEKAIQAMDVICLNRYEGWYSLGGRLDLVVHRIGRELSQWQAKYQKPVILTEYGAEALSGYHSLPSTMWTENYQIELLKEHFKAFDSLRQDDALAGEMLWNFADFKVPQEYFRAEYCNKGIFTRNRQPKGAAYTIKSRYTSLVSIDRPTTVGPQENQSYTITTV